MVRCCTSNDLVTAVHPLSVLLALYHSVVTAIAGGNTSQTAVAQTLGREQRSVQHPLRALEDAGFVVATDDALRSRRPIYQIADPIVRFHHVVTRRDLARWRRASTDARQLSASICLARSTCDLRRE